MTDRHIGYNHFESPQGRRHAEKALKNLYLPIVVGKSEH